jgi:hypothetical protein
MASTVPAALAGAAPNGDGRRETIQQITEARNMLRSVRWRGARHVHVVPATRCLLAYADPGTEPQLEAWNGVSGRWTDDDDNNDDDLFQGTEVLPVLFPLQGYTQIYFRSV